MIWTVQWNLRRNGKTYSPGDTLEGLTEEEAREANLYPGVLEPAEEQKPDKQEPDEKQPEDEQETDKQTPDEPPTLDITDAAAALAEEHDLDLSDTIGSGEGGRILKSDVQSIIDDA